MEDWVTVLGPGFPKGVAELITTDGGGPAVGRADVSPAPGTGPSRTTSSTENVK